MYTKKQIAPILLLMILCASLVIIAAFSKPASSTCKTEPAMKGKCCCKPAKIATDKPAWDFIAQGIFHLYS